MKKPTTITLLLLLSLSLFSQWEVKHADIDSYHTINEIKFYDQSNGLAVGTDGLVLRSTDFGESWEKIESIMTGSVTDFDYINLDTILAVSGDFVQGVFTRRVYKSIDGGDTWAEKFSDEGDVNSVVVINSNEAIISGSDFVYKSNDGGENWYPVYEMTSEGFKFGEVRKMQMIDEHLGYAVGAGLSASDNTDYYGFLLRTQNSGETWEIIQQFEGWMQNLYFLNAEEGYITEGEFTYKTLDGGNSWEVLNNIFGVVEFAAPAQDKIMSVNRPIAYIPEAPSTEFAISTSTDAGINWDGFYRPGAHLETIHFLSDSVGFVAGDYSIIMKTENCGGEIIGDYPWHLFGPNSINDIEQESLAFYPNPSSNQIYLADEYVNADWNLTIISSDGRIILEDKPDNLKVDVSWIPTGFYTVIIQNKERRIMSKLIVE